MNIPKEPWKHLSDDWHNGRSETAKRAFLSHIRYLGMEMNEDRIKKGIKPTLYCKNSRLVSKYNPLFLFPYLIYKFKKLFHDRRKA
jgi:hypothetical protein